MRPYDQLVAWLSRWNGFQECFLHSLDWRNWFYSIEVYFNYIWGADGHVRQDVLERPLLVGVKLVGVEDLHLTGALTEGMKSEPWRINWGLAEVALVRAIDRGQLTSLSVEWESDRRLEVTFVSLEILDGPTIP